jgi:hypothetical protein
LPIFTEEKPVENVNILPLHSDSQDNESLKKPLKKLNRDDRAPSIKDALAGKLQDDIISPKDQHTTYSNKGDKSDFSREELKEKWNEYVKKLVERPNLQSTLSKVPSVTDNFNLELEVDNSMQEDLINSIKPELVAWLRKELKNSTIELQIKITEKEQQKIIYSDTDKYIEMVKKNPKLELLKNKFKLDFD